MTVALALYSFFIVYPWFVYPVLLKLKRTPTRPPRWPYQEDAPRWLVVTAGRNAGVKAVHHCEYIAWLCRAHGNAEAVYVDDFSAPGEFDELLSAAHDLKLNDLTILGSAEHGGKEKAIDNALAYARAEEAANDFKFNFVLFLDLGVRIEVKGDSDNPLAAIDVLGTFQDQEVAGVAFSDHLPEPGYYLPMEMMIRQLESDAGGLIGAGGMALAYRVHGLPETVKAPADLTLVRHSKLSDQIVIHGGDDYIARYNPPAFGQYQRSVRTAMRGMAAVQGVPFETWWNFKLISHKHLRWLSSILIAINPITWMLLAVRPALVKPHIAILHAWLMTIAGKRVTKWEGTKR